MSLQDGWFQRQVQQSEKLSSLRPAFDEIEKAVINGCTIKTVVTADIEAAEPEKDNEGKTWSTFKDTGKRRIVIEIEPANVSIKEN